VQVVSPIGIRDTVPATWNPSIVPVSRSVSHVPADERLTDVLCLQREGTWSSVGNGHDDFRGIVAGCRGQPGGCPYRIDPDAQTTQEQAYTASRGGNLNLRYNLLLGSYQQWAFVDGVDNEALQRRGTIDGN